MGNVRPPGDTRQGLRTPDATRGSDHPRPRRYQTFSTTPETNSLEHQSYAVTNHIDVLC